MTVLLDCGPSLRGWSHQESILVCPWRWARSYLDDHTYRVPSEPLVKGALVHVGLAHYWSWKMGQQGLLAPVDAVYALAKQEDERLTPWLGYVSRVWQDHVDVAAKLVQRYCEVQPLAHLKPIAIEHHVALWVDLVDGVWTLVAPPADAAFREKLADEGRWLEFYRLGAPWLSTFRADLLAELPDGRVVVIDHKTGYRLDERKVRGFQTSGQMLQYQLWGALGLGSRFGGVHVSFLNFSALTGRGVPFASFQVSSSAAAVSLFPQAVADRAEMIKGLVARDPTGQSWPRAFREQGPCSDRYGTCDFFGVCVG